MPAYDEISPKEAHQRLTIEQTEEDFMTDLGAAPDLDRSIISLRRSPAKR